MDVEFKKSFEKDLSKLRDKTLLTRIKAVIFEIEAAENLESLNNVKEEIDSITARFLESKQR